MDLIDKACDYQELLKLFESAEKELQLSSYSVCQQTFSQERSVQMRSAAYIEACASLCDFNRLEDLSKRIWMLNDLLTKKEHLETALANNQLLCLKETVDNQMQICDIKEELLELKRFQASKSEYDNDNLPALWWQYTGVSCQLDGLKGLLISCKYLLNEKPNKMFQFHVKVVDNRLQAYNFRPRINDIQIELDKFSEHGDLITLVVFLRQRYIENLSRGKYTTAD